LQSIHLVNNPDTQTSATELGKHTTSRNYTVISNVVAELFAGVKGDAEQAALENFISLFPVVPVSAEIGKVGGLYKRDYGKSHGVGIADAILAATAEAENAELKTLNEKHYPMLKGITRPYKK
jgi:predicted nucleic acid-binding protein